MLSRLAAAALLGLAVAAAPVSAQATRDDLLAALTSVLGPVAADDNEAGDATHALLLQTATVCRDRLEHAWDQQRSLAQGWTLVGAATDTARQLRVYTIADPDGALWSVAVVAADMCYLELSGSGHRAPPDDWRFALPPLQPVDANPVELPW